MFEVRLGDVQHTRSGQYIPVIINSGNTLIPLVLGESQR